jgi:hypothetical protein
MHAHTRTHASEWDRLLIELIINKANLSLINKLFIYLKCPERSGSSYHPTLTITRIWNEAKPPCVEFHGVSMEENNVQRSLGPRREEGLVGKVEVRIEDIAMT